MKTDIQIKEEEAKKGRLVFGKMSNDFCNKILVLWCGGRTITVKKKLTIENLAFKFLKEHPHLVKISYSLFCMLQPFGIMFPKVEAR